VGPKKVITIIVFATLLVVGCGEKAAEGPSPDELSNEIAGVAGNLNAYLSEHNFANTDAGTLAAEITTLADKYGELEKQAQGLEDESGDEAYGDVAGLAGEGHAKAEALASAVAAGPPMGEPDKVAALHVAIDDWAAYSDRISAPPGEAAPPTGEEPRVGEPSEPGEPSVGEPSEPATPLYPGKGHHYGWWKNPEWARDRGTRPLVEGEPPGAGEKERERERNRTQPGSGKGGGKGGKGHGRD
jgi:hypothetical protein